MAIPSRDPSMGSFSTLSLDLLELEDCRSTKYFAWGKAVFWNVISQLAGVIMFNIVALGYLSDIGLPQWASPFLYGAVAAFVILFFYTTFLVLLSVERPLAGFRQNGLANLPSERRSLLAWFTCIGVGISMIAIGIALLNEEVSLKQMNLFIAGGQITACIAQIRHGISIMEHAFKLQADEKTGDAR
jgi:hypothetical protein